MNSTAQRLKTFLETNNSPVFVDTCEISTAGTARKVKYLVPNGTHGSQAIQDITQQVARAMGVENRVDQLGRLSIKGGDGEDMINSLSILLFDTHKTIQVFTLR